METVIFCSGAKHLKSKFKRGFEVGENKIEVLPDGEFKQKLSQNINFKGKKVFVIQSFYKDNDFSINDRIFEALSVYHNLKSLGTKNICLIATHFPYLRGDSRFEVNLAISAKISAKLFSVFNKIFIFEPHLHRLKSLSEFFPNAKKVSVKEFMVNEIKKIKTKRTLLIGPDSESEIWVKPISKALKIDSEIMKKKRLSPKAVNVKITCDINHDEVILIDDICSTGKTLYETIRQIKCKKIYAFICHGIFNDKKIIKKLKKLATIFSTNTIPIKEKGIKVIDISPKIKEIINKN